MDVVPIRPEHVERLWEIYRAQVADVPHCRFIPDLAGFRDDVLMRAPRLRQEGQRFDVLVAETAGAVEGFVALTTYEDDEDEPHHQAMTGLFVTSEAVGHALVEACEARATVDRLFAFPASHGNTVVQTYNAGWDALSSAVPRVAGVLAQHGYTPFTRELGMIASLDGTRQDVTMPAPLVLDGPKQQSAPHAWSLIVRAMDGDERVGVCSFSDLVPVVGSPQGSQTGYIWGLHVNEAYRRHGIARGLMAAAMKHLRSLGCTECWLTTTADNWSAQALYYGLGFEVVDCSVSFRKTLHA